MLTKRPAARPPTLATVAALLALQLIAGCVAGASSGDVAKPTVWVAAWTSAQQEPEPHNALPPDTIGDATLRQIVRLSLGGDAVRVRLSNAFGQKPLRIGEARLARAVAPGDSGIVAVRDWPITFSGRSDVVIPSGAEVVSDPVALPVAAFDDLAVSLYLPAAPEPQTGHPGARTTSFALAGRHVSDAGLVGAMTVEHWYQLSGVDVAAPMGAEAIAVLGDSITDGRGSTTNGNDRWTDFLARRLQADPATRHLSVLNQGIGGNRLLEHGLGPNALARLDRDALAPAGVRHLIVLIGVNDLGVLGRGGASAEDHQVLAERIIAGYEQIVRRAHARALRVYGGTMPPYGGSDVYAATPASEAARATINDWIRTSGAFDGVIDFDAALRDPDEPGQLRAEYDSGDRLHPSPAGFRAMADAVPMELLAR